MKLPLQPGILLIAKPTLIDPNFKRTVVLLVSHDDHGTLGLVLNRPTPITYAAAFSGAGIEAEGFLYQGGPVEPTRLFVLHRLGLAVADSQQVFDSVHFSGDLRGVIAAGAESEERPAFRGYLGCAGWGRGQLEGEMEHGAWILSPAEPASVFFDRPEQLWSELLYRMGGQYALMSLMPPDPEQN